MPQRPWSVFSIASWRLAVPVLVASALAGCGSSAAHPTTTLGSTTTSILAASTTTTLLPLPTVATTVATGAATTTGTAGADGGTAPTGATAAPAPGAPAPGATAAAGTTTSVPPRPCVPAQLSIMLGTNSVAAGRITRTYRLQNSSSTPCTVAGYPALAPLDASAKMLPTTLVQATGYAKSTVSLSPGGYGAFAASWADAAGYPGATCPTSTSLEITLPGATTHLTVAGTAGGAIQAFGGTVARLRCGTITVTPLGASAA